MKKSIIAITSILVLSAFTVPANAAEKPTVAIIDNGFDTSIISNVVAEVCIVKVKYGCNNGKLIDESIGSTKAPVPILPNWKSEWDHGTKMASIVNQINPNANLLLIRNAFVPVSGAVGMGGQIEFGMALDWVIANKIKYNIQAVSFSRGSNLVTKTGVCPVETGLQQKIIALQNVGVPTIIAAGNDRDKVNVSYPGCIPEAVAIGGIFSASYTPKVWSSYYKTLGTNDGVAVDFFAYGNFKTPLGAVAESTSSSTAAFAGYWSKVSNGNYFETYEKLSKSTSNKFINVLN